MFLRKFRLGKESAGEIRNPKKVDSEALKRKVESIKPHLNERQWRLYLASEARSLGRGGVTQVASVSGVTRATIHIGLLELDGLPLPPTQVRQSGGGRKKLRDKNPGLVKALRTLIDPETRGDPESPLLYTTQSTRQLSRALKTMGHSVSHDVVHNTLQEEGYSLQTNVKTREGSENPNRDAQFQYLNAQVKDHLESSQPVISVDTKKKELVGDFKNAGRQWRPKRRPHHVRVHDFPSDAIGKAIPYGVYDVAKNTGWVGVGTDHDTSEFAVQTIRRWWNNEGVFNYPDATRLLITADGGGSNGSRNRLWKRELCRFAEEANITITVCHLPPGTSKWNKIEHRLFSHISLNWRGQPLISHEVVVGLINGTSTTKGLTVNAELDKGNYPTKIKVSDQEMGTLPVVGHEVHPNWNYTISPSSRAKED